MTKLINKHKSRKKVKPLTDSRPGPVKWWPTPEIIKKAREFASLGITEGQMQEYFNVGKDTWIDRKRECVELQEALGKGRVGRIELVVSKLMEKILEGNLDAIKFFLSRRADWIEKIQSLSNVTDDEKKVPELQYDFKDPVEAARIYQQIMTKD